MRYERQLGMLVTGILLVWVVLLLTLIGGAVWWFWEVFA